MLSSYWGVVRDGKIEPREPTALPEGAQVLVTVLSDEDAGFWQRISEESLKSVWDNAEDDVYGELLAR
ncbi:MAG TPA: hypothetical protein VGI40_24265 [Pirellulaceae bacterium]|jgi:hypothetical protein